MVETSGRSLRELIEELGKIAEVDIRKEILGEEGNLDPRFKIVVNGVDYDDLNFSLSHGDEVMLFSAIDGG